VLAGLGYGLYGCGLVFYILFLRASNRLARECRPTDPPNGLPGANWLMLWREHRRLFPESDLRWRLPLRIAMVGIFVAGGTVLTVLAQTRGF
jgi:hypothetical protein